MPTQIQSNDAPVATSTLKRKRPDQDILPAIDNLVDRMRSQTSIDPYIVTIPQDDSQYRHAYQYQTVQWLYETPFSGKERERIQYQTFHFKEHGTDMFVLENSYIEPRHEPVKTKSAPTAKTTYSFNAYKMKRPGNTPLHTEQKKEEAAAEGSALDLAEKTRADPLREVGRIIQDGETGPSAEKPPTIKRKRNEESTVDSGAHWQNGSRSPKRQRGASPDLPSRRETVLTSTAIDKKKDERHRPQDDTKAATPLPPRLLPPRLSPLQIDPLPPRISPTFPDNITQGLAELDAQKASDRPVKLNNASLDVAKDGPSANSKKKPAVSSGPERGAKPATSGNAEIEQNVNSVKVEKPADVRKPVVAQAIKVESSPQLIVKLKFKSEQLAEFEKANNTRLDADDGDTIRCKPREVPATKTSSTKSIVRTSGSKGLGRTSVTGTILAEERTTNPISKDSVADGSATDMSGLKRPLTADRPSTPSQLQLGQSGITSSKSSKLAPPLTPTFRKDHLSTAMARQLSSDSLVNTPSGRATSTSGVGDKAAKIPPSLGPINSQSSRPARTQKQQAWEVVQKKYETLGRELKHEAQRLREPTPKDGGPRLTTVQSKTQAAIRALESMLAYVLAFCCADHVIAIAEPRLNPSAKTWSTLTGFYAFVRRTCEPIAPLKGLACILGLVFTGRIMTIVEQLPFDAHPAETMHEVYKTLLQASDDLDAMLDMDQMMESFPNSWSRRSIGRTAAQLNNLGKPGEFSGLYKLPVMQTTPPLLGARAVHAMLQEWLSGQHGIDFELKLKLNP